MAEDIEYKSESPFLDMIQTEVEDWRDGYARIAVALRPELLNRAGVPHGGLIATLLDHASSFCGLYCTQPGNRRYGMTLSLSCDFIGQSTGGRLTAIGVLTKSGRSVYFSSAEVLDSEGKLLGRSTSVHRYRTGSEDPNGVPFRAGTRRSGRGD
jgi:uncharacterized protein (TIGR00369 family)